MRLLTILSLLLSVSAFSAECNYLIKKSDVKVSWSAFKTPLKAPVGGSFDKVGVTKDIKGKDLQSLLVGTPFNIQTSSVNTKNKDRDIKIASFFFGPIGPSIKGKVLKYEKKVLKIALTMNGVTKVIPLKLTISDPQIIALGVIDILDFNMQNSLMALNNACKELHQGKTWSDVIIKLEAKYSKICK